MIETDANIVESADMEMPPQEVAEMPHEVVEVTHFCPFLGGNPQCGLCMMGIRDLESQEGRIGVTCAIARLGLEGRNDLFARSLWYNREEELPEE